MPKSLSHIYVNSYKGPISEKLQYYGSLDEEKISVDKMKQSSIKISCSVRLPVPL
jgi:hypothetical protein